MPWYTYSGIYLIIWSALLIHCLLQRGFYPIFGQRWGTKVFWLFTFVFLNPFLTLIYFFFGFLLSFWKVKADGRGHNSQIVGLGSAIAITLIGVVLVLFELPLSSGKTEPVIIQNTSEKSKPSGQEDPSDRFQAHLGLINAGNKIQTMSSTSAGSGTRVSMRNIMIICQSPHDLLDCTMHEFQKSLVQLPYVKEVTYYPFGTWPKPGGLLPDVFITINMPQVTEKSFLHSRNLKAIIKWTAGSSIFAGTSYPDHSDTFPVVRFDIESELEHESQMFGIESSKAKYMLAADDICNEMIKSISKQFENLLDKYGQMPESPEMLYGKYHEPPKLSFLESDKVRLLISGRGLLKNNRTIWRFVSDRQTDKALAACQDELKSLGWEQEDIGDEYLQMRKGDEHIYIFRNRQRNSKAGTIFWSEPEKITAEATLIADYESNFNDDQMKEAMDALLESGVEMKTLLIFEKFFRTPKQLERLQSVIGKSQANTLDGNLMLARFWVDRGQTDKGQELLMRARVMQRTEKDHNLRAEEIRDLARELGDESLAEVPISEEVFRRMGFINPEQLKEPVEFEKSINEPVLFYHHLDDGELQTFALRIIPSYESSYSMPYYLLTVESREGSSSSSENEGKLRPGDVWVVDTSINAFTDESKSIQLQVKSLDNEHFLFAITP
jgi:hypothetical protein